MFLKKQFLGDNCRVIVTMVGNRHEYLSSNPGRSTSHFYITLIPWERYAFKHSLSSYGEIIGKTMLFGLVMATSLGEGKL